MKPMAFIDLSWIGDTVQGLFNYKMAQHLTAWATANGPLALLLAIGLGLPASLWALHKSQRTTWTWNLNGVATIMALAVYLILLGYVGVLLWGD